MNLRLLALASCALFSAAFARADDYAFKEPFSRAAAFNADGKVSLQNVNGEVTVTAWDKNEIRIEGEKSARTEEELKAIDLTIELSANRAEIRVRLPKRSGGWFGGNTIRANVRFKLMVPATASLDGINTVNGSVHVQDVRGPARLETVNGQVHAENLGGPAHVRTVNGSIKASFAQIAADQKLSFNTVNGSIEVALPSDAGADVHASVVNGDIDCDFPLQLQGRIGRKSINGRIGDGRASIQAESVNGGIHLRKR